MVSPTLKMGWGVDSGVGVLLAGGSGRSRKRGITWLGSGEVAVIRSYAMPGTETGRAPDGASSWKSTRLATSRNAGILEYIP